jgi:hypothetical protein
MFVLLYCRMSITAAATFKAVAIHAALPPLPRVFVMSLF